ncbi:hypothetical protein K474DRAFT_1658226 [Panus rudis PR-1116 ss-1]|nr:hypothetical protein K474DRAFT_1658226 [Panus rudis PR-1116 ss-1]
MLSILGGAPRHSALQGTSKAAAGSLTQVRGYAQPKAAVAKTSRQGFKKKGKPTPTALDIEKRTKRIFSFKPLPASRLGHPVFEAGKTESLDLPVFRPDHLTEERALGKAFSFPADDKAPIKIFGLPKNLSLEYKILSKPSTVVRDVSLTAFDKLDAASMSSSQENRIVLTGSSGVGKSIVLLQAVHYCLARDWIALYLPRAYRLLDSSTPYVYDPRTRTYVQPEFSYQLLMRFQTVNSSKLDEVKTSEEFPIPEKGSLPKGSSLNELVNLGLQDHLLAPSVFAELLTELSKQDKYPVLLAIDDIQALYNRTTGYRNPRFEAIKPYHIHIPRLLLEFSSGKRQLRRGAVLGAISEGRKHFPLEVELREALGIPHDRPTGPYVKRTQEMVEYSQGLQNLAVPEKLSVEEAASIFELWNADKALHSAPDDELFMTKYSEASGNARAFVWKGLLATLSS